jgi:hypothetical protein
VSVLVSAGAKAWRWMFHQTANPATYAPQIGAPFTLAAFIRGVRSEDLFASAQQQDVAAIIDAAEFVANGVRLTPARYDRLRTVSSSYTIEEWRGAPNDDAPVFFKLLLRGGTQ